MTAHSPSDRRAGDRPQGGDKRERILDAAERVFARHGFFNARVAEIARDAGVADGTIYLYFKSKDDLLISLFESRMERINRQLAERVAAETTAADRLRTFLHAYAELARDQPHVAEVLTIELRQSSKFMKEYANPRFAEFLRTLSSIIERGQADGELRADVPAPVAARALFGAIDELVLAWVLGGHEKFDIVRAAEQLGQMMLHGLAVAPDECSP
ncbi:MAG: TetR/AcrR family transcriptional regulator [Deltaproteobacteria bacterium]|nr:MAG: TetR/AcrR family transcriptional regulator [Deltaproteobacteria bacterium]